ncbi:MAG: heavy metal transport/detoxification protein [Bacteroidetes bacterium]|nr:heavy metal transport/detoxification protein [Bacteroidota bacterium]
MKFKTNIKCDGCIATVTPILDQAVGAGNWSVDLSSPWRLLTISQIEISPEVIKTGLATVGYQADEIKGQE